MSQRETDNARRILGLLGLCRRAGKLVMGTSLACLAMAEKKPPALAVVSKIELKQAELDGRGCALHFKL